LLLGTGCSALLLHGCRLLLLLLDRAAAAIFAAVGLLRQLLWPCSGPCMQKDSKSDYHRQHYNVKKGHARMHQHPLYNPKNSCSARLA
jgi:hypothetical protein